jgi:AGZA family xanthine/uracil permease-like MFS transporter
MSDRSVAGEKPARWLVRGDIDGFFGLALDNLIQVLVILALCTHVLGFSAEITYGRMLPGIAVSLIVGNLFYAWQAKKLADRLGRDDVCALPYGINTVSLFAFVFLVMLPVKLGATNSGASPIEASEMAWRAGVVAALGSGLIEGGGSWLVAWLRKWTPRAAMLSTLAGIAVTFIAAGFLFRTFASPLVAFLPFGAVILTYFGRVRFPGGIPGGLVALVLGTGLAWATPFLDWDAEAFRTAAAMVGFHPPIPTLGPLFSALAEGHFTTYLAIIVPMGLFNVVGSLQNLDSAAAAGDDYPTIPSLLVNGVGTIVGACFGSPFPTTIYIGHPGWKALGARIGYSVLNAIFFTLLGLTGASALIGYLIPIEAGMAIVLWIGIIMVAQSFQATPGHHAPAVAIGLLPGIAAWGALMIKAGLRAAGMGTPDKPFTDALIATFKQADVFVHGAFAVEQGFLLVSMIWAALTVEVIERRFLRAAAWAAGAAVLSLLGLIHAYGWTMADTVQVLQPGLAWEWALAYGLLALLLASGKFFPKEAGPGHG